MKIKSKKDYDKILEAQVMALSALQLFNYASNCYVMLVVVHSMDTAGKCRAIQHNQRKPLTPKFEGG